LFCLFATSVGYTLDERGYRQLHIFAEVLHQVEKNYVDPIDTKKLITGAVDGMLATLDPHTVYMEPDVYKELKTESVGRFSGVGVEVSIENGWLTVVAPIEDSPAWKAGIRSKDKIVRINGVSTKGMSLGEAVRLMRGREGSGIRVTVMREGVEHPLEFYLKREAIKVPSVTVEDMGDGYLYARISVFQERTAMELKEKLGELHKKGDIKGLIIDLRNNPGGLLTEAVDVADLFLSKGVIVSTKNKEKEVSRYEAKEGDDEPNYPILVLIDGGSASASEILAGALKDYKRALIIGSQSFGKGSVQSVIELSNGAALKITVAKYYTPSGTSIQGSGITPNVIVEEKEGGPSMKEVALAYLKDPKRYQKAIHLVGERMK